MTMVQISESKKVKLSDYAEKVLHYAGKMMQCIESLDEGGEYGERGYGERGGYGGRMGMRDYDDMDEREYGERRGVRGTGPYSRYR